MKNLSQRPEGGDGNSFGLRKSQIDKIKKLCIVGSHSIQVK